jgi:phage terminase large subunit GpA-like protein
MKLSRATDLYNNAFNGGLKPDPELLLSEWAERNRVLPEGIAREHGQYSMDLTPFWREPLDCLSPSCQIQEIAVQKGVQIAGTTMGENLVLACMDMGIGPCMMVLPTVEIAEDFSRDRLQPSIDAMSCLKGKVRPQKSKFSGNTILHKRYKGGSLKLVGGNSAKSFRNRPVRVLILDDIDGFDLVAGKEGDTISLAKKRTVTFGNIKKIYENSTPTEKDFSRIERSFLDSDQRWYYVPCPHCQEMQVLKWGGKEAVFGLKFIHDGPVVTDCWYQCGECQQRIDEHHKTWMLAHGEWRPHNEFNHTRRGYHLSSLYSPIGWRSWREICQEFLSAGKDEHLLQVWTNTILAETWERKGTQPEWESIRNRAEPYNILEVPTGGMILTASVDVQKDRLEVSVWAWGRDEECWLIYFGPIFENPESDTAWTMLDQFLSQSIVHSNSVNLDITSVGIDAAFHTQRVYSEVRKRQPKWFALKGQPKANRPIIGRPTDQDINCKGAVVKGGIQLWPVGVDIGKSTLYSRLKIIPPGPRSIHTPIGMDDDFYRQITAEKLMTKYSKGFPSQEWVKIYERNEALDLWV